jgi:K+-sensing histidine kinase KdpD
MKNIRLTPNMLGNGFKGMLIAMAITVPMWLIGRDVLGEGAIGLLYLAPIAWGASKWGRVAGMSAALTAALCFDYLFIPPFHTFAIGSLEGWLVLVIFLAIAIVVVGRIQDSLSKAHESAFMYELSSALANARTQEAVAQTLARYIRQLFQAARVKVTFQQAEQAPRIAMSASHGTSETGQPDRILPILNAWGLVGEIQIWRGEFADLPTEDGRLLQDFAAQAARAFERTQAPRLEQRAAVSLTEAGLK